ncbi:MAG: metallophosphoesterase family protein [Anaerolineales bacterium]
MRIAFLSDIHGNYTALQAVLQDLAAQQIDLFVSLGDTVSLGPQPLEVLHALQSLNGRYIMGNHDAATLDPSSAVQNEITDYLIPDLHWALNKLSAQDRAFMTGFESTVTLTLPNGVKILAFHGSPLATTHIIQATTPPADLDVYFGAQDADIFIGGHSHVQMIRRYGEKLILNTGSIGSAFKFTYTPGTSPVLLPWAEYMLIEQRGETVSVDARRVSFDVAEVHHLVRASDLPGSAWWLRQYQG